MAVYLQSDPSRGEAPDVVPKAIMRETEDARMSLNRLEYAFAIGVPEAANGLWTLISWE